MPKNAMQKFVCDIGCEDDANEVWCPVRVIGLSGAATVIIGSLYVAFAHGTFDAIAVGTAIAAIVGAVGAGAGIKAKLGG